ncbi:ATP-binding cassette domain-containing protein [Caulobacter sp. S45]|uniref:ATP-binding cassette domain-containing protein n=1 Tax=Caulobacter sp. S45 TaxID=1641861 RepID=UPI00131D3B6A|nr:ATP-binding cassette domain-containing protein [Caulobacter sp. S45]
MTGAQLHIRNLLKTYGARSVLAGIDLDVAAGEFVAVVGRSGTGKSTLLRLIVGLEQPSAGNIEGPISNQIRLMFQEPRLLPWARVGANVEVGLGNGHDRARAHEALQAVGLADRADAWPDILSGGQRQRVALARALVSNPTVLAFDEPLGALDALTRIEMQRLIERIWREQGFTALLVTHDVSEAIALADRVLVIEGGHIALDLAIDLARPRARGSAAFAALEGRLLAALLAPAVD